MSETCTKCGSEMHLASECNSGLCEEMGRLRTRLQQVESERDEAIERANSFEGSFNSCLNDRDKAEADAAVMRGALEKCHATFLTLERLKGYSTEVPPNIVLQAVIKLSEALATNCGRSIQERVKLAEELLDPKALENLEIHKWMERRDTFLNPKPQDVK